jgi:hypothetical protein
VKYEIDVHNKDGQHSYVDLVMYLMVSRSGNFTVMNIDIFQVDLLIGLCNDVFELCKLGCIGWWIIHE